MWCAQLLLLFLMQFTIKPFGFTLPTSDSLYEGSNCLQENGESGICKRLPDCPSKLEEVRNGRRGWDSAGRCGFDNFVEIVCCPVNITDKIGLRAADVACQQYENEIMLDNVKTKDEVTLHIFGGTEAQSGEFPYMAALGYESLDDDGPSVKYTCGGTLISSQYVLTAAHCVSNVHERVPIEVKLGNNDISSSANDVQRIPINDIITHPRYKRSMNYNDVAILKLKRHAQMTNTVKPICLQTRSLEEVDPTEDASLVVVGWGSTTFDNDGSNRLMRTPSLRAACVKHYNGFLKLPHGLDDNLICAADTNLTRRADACHGDSGGPLLMLSKTGDSIVGVTAFGQTCGSAVPGVYTAIYPFLDWIEEQVWWNEEIN